ncbi:MAG: dephospho-CoA kinase [Bacteroidia bacterium]|nr:dephospho-CoA kinase [Bacteroidia bacterium]
MHVIGITGGIGSGKSYVCRLFEGLGYAVYYADDRAKALMTESPEVRSGVIGLFGPAAYLPDGSLNRPLIAERVFGTPALREALNAVVHPAVAADGQAWVTAQRAAGQKAFVLREAAILFESGEYRGCDAVITVYAPEAVRLGRVLKRDGSTEAAVRQRMAAQWPEAQKLLHADFAIYNDGTHQLLPQLAACLRWAHSL